MAIGRGLFGAAAWMCVRSLHVCHSADVPCAIITIIITISAVAINTLVANVKGEVEKGLHRFWVVKSKNILIGRFGLFSYFLFSWNPTHDILTLFFPNVLFFLKWKHYPMNNTEKNQNNATICKIRVTHQTSFYFSILWYPIRNSVKCLIDRVSEYGAGSTLQSPLPILSKTHTRCGCVRGAVCIVEKNKISTGGNIGFRFWAVQLTVRAVFVPQLSYIRMEHTPCIFFLCFCFFSSILGYIM